MSESATVTESQATDAVSLKRFFKDQYQIPVRVRSLRGRTGYIEVRIPAVRTARHTDPLRYDHAFPTTLTRHCLRLVYPKNPDLHDQDHAGNIQRHSICMPRPQWQTLLQQLTQAQ